MNEVLEIKRSGHIFDDFTDTEKGGKVNCFTGQYLPKIDDLSII
jgi:hypothetical protein